MDLALREAKKAYLKGEIPVGCVIVKDSKVIARAHNKKEEKKDATSHAEILAIKKASKKLNNWRLDDCEIYVTLEPCVMCMGAIMQAHIKTIYYSLNDNAMGACESKIKLQTINFQNPPIKVYGHIQEDESKELLQNFFKDLRNKRI